MSPALNVSTVAQVSIIIPTYNYAAYLRKAIDSALEQSYPNVEVIVVDDGSTDETQSILKEYGDRIRNILQPNQGASVARNRGIEISSGEMIAFLDADDAYQSENISEKVKFLTEHSEYAWCYSDWAWVNDAGEAYKRGSEVAVSLACLKAQGDVFLKALQGYRLGTNVFLFRREVLESIDGFDESFSVLEDYDLYLRAAAIFPLGYVDRVLCNVFQHEGSLGTGSSKQLGYYSRWRLNRKLSKLFPDQIAKVAGYWHGLQADIYRNLAELALTAGYRKRAMVLLCASFAWKRWQPGVVLLWWRIKRGH